MDKSAVESVAELAKKGFTIEVSGETYSPFNMQRIYNEPRPDGVHVNTLTGICDYLIANVDEVDLSTLFAIVRCNKVMVLSKAYGETLSRDQSIISEFNPVDFNFNSFMNVEEFMIEIKSKFLETPDLKTLLSFISKIDMKTTISLEDDGVSQVVNVQKGVSGQRVEGKVAPSIVRLRPYRTFYEVEQPESDFLFRIKSYGETVSCGLFEADGQRWKNVAAYNVSEFLKVNLPKEVQVIF